MRIRDTTTLSTTGSTRGTAYGMSNKIITAGGRVFATWLDSLSDAKVATFDIAAGRWSAPVLLGRGIDNHCGGALTMDSAGHLYAVFGTAGGPSHDDGLNRPKSSHDGLFQLRRSVRPRDASEWEPIELFGERCCYPSVVCGPDDTLHCTCRGGADPRPRRLIYQRRPAGGGWSAPREIVHCGLEFGENNYSNYGNSLAVSPDGVLHLGFHIYTGRRGRSPCLGYLRSPDGGLTWETSAGRRVELPVGPEAEGFIEQGEDMDVRVGNVVIDPDGRPWMTAMRQLASPRTARLWRFDGRSWEMRDLLATVRAGPGDREIVSAGMTFDADGVMYVAATVMEQGAEKRAPDRGKAGGWFGHTALEWVLLTSADRGESFEITAICPPDPDTPNWLASLERPFSAAPVGVPSVLYTHGTVGRDGMDPANTEILFVRLERE